MCGYIICFYLYEPRKYGSSLISSGCLLPEDRWDTMTWARGHADTVPFCKQKVCNVRDVVFSLLVFPALCKMIFFREIFFQSHLVHVRAVHACTGLFRHGADCPRLLRKNKIHEPKIHSQKNIVCVDPKVSEHT
jgi:hypothetical protein